MTTFTNKMTTELISIGNSKGIRLNKKLLEQTGFVASATVEVVKGGKLVITPIKKKPREGWAEEIQKANQLLASSTIKQETYDYCPTKFDENEWEW